MDTQALIHLVALALAAVACTGLARPATNASAGVSPPPLSTPGEAEPGDVVLDLPTGVATPLSDAIPHELAGG